LENLIPATQLAYSANENNGHPAFVGNNSGEFLEATSDKSEYRFLHDGTGMTLCFVLKVSAGSSCTFFRDTFAADTGIIINHSDFGFRQIGIVVFNDLGSQVVSLSSTSDIYELDETFLLVIRIESGRTGNDVEIRINGVQAGAQTNVSGADTGDSTANLVLGFTSGDAPISISEVAAFTEFKSDSEVEFWEAGASQFWSIS